MNNNERSILFIPRIAKSYSTGVELKPEIVQLYNHTQKELKISRWPDFRLLPLTSQYPKWKLLFDRCSTENMDPKTYLTWVLQNSELIHPACLLNFSLSNGCFWRYLQSLRGAPPQNAVKATSPAKFGAFGDRLLDERTGNPVQWIFDARGELLITPPSSGEVFDQQGHRITLRRSR